MKRFCIIIVTVVSLLVIGQARAQSVELISPIGMVFAGIGKSLSGAATGAVSLNANGAAFRNRLNSARSAFTNCYPKCSINVRNRFSQLLNDRDAYYFSLRAFPFLGGPGMRQGAIDLFEGLSGGMGHQVGDRCRRQFQGWVFAYLIARDGKIDEYDPSVTHANFMAKHGTAMQASRGKLRTYINCRDFQELKAIRFLK